MTVLHGDCLRILKAQTQTIADVCITDPPYNVGIDFGRGRKADMKQTDDYVRWLSDRLREAARVVRYGIVYFPGKRMMWEAPRVLQLAGLMADWQLLGWHKREFCGDVWPTGRPAMCWEPVVWAKKGKGFIDTSGHGAKARDFFAVNSHRQETGAVAHPTVKPLEVMDWLVTLFCPKGGTVLDPFAGSGTTGLVCQRTGRGAVLIEKNAKYVKLSRKRLENDNPIFRLKTPELPFKETPR